MSVAQVAGRAGTVLHDAQAGDARAAAILDTTANDLYRMIESVARRCPPQTPLAFSGGLLRERNALTRAIATAHCRKRAARCASSRVASSRMLVRWQWQPASL